jgi:hypothetical protein
MKKIFTLIAMAAMALGVNAPTEIRLAGLKMNNLTWDATYQEITDYVEVDNNENPTGYTAPLAFTYSGGGAWADIALKNQPVKFSYKNSGEKIGFFSAANDFFQIGGKGAKLIISNLKKEQTVTVTIAAKADDAAPEFSVTGANLTSGDPATATSTTTFVDLVYTVNTSAGEMTIENTTNAYRIKTIVIAGEGVEPGSFDGKDFSVTWKLTDPNDLSAVASNSAGMSGSSVTTGSGMEKLSDALVYSVKDGDGKVIESYSYTTFQPTLSDKGKNEYKNCVDNNKNIDFTFTPTANFSATKISLDIAKVGTGDPQVFIDFIEGDGSVTAVTSAALDIVRNNDAQFLENVNKTFDISTFASDKPVTLRIWVGKLANNKQVAIANVVISGKIDKSVPTGISTVKNETINLNAPAYNLAGQKVAEGYKGVVIQNGVKRIQK